MSSTVFQPLVRSISDEAVNTVYSTRTTHQPVVSDDSDTGCSLSRQNYSSSAPRLNKFVRRLHDMLVAEKDSGIVEWRRGLLVLHSTDAFSKLLPRYFNTRNFKTFRRQLNYYGFVHARSLSTTGASTTALWVHSGLARTGSDDIASVLLLRRVEPCESAKTSEGRRVRKEQALHTVSDLGLSAKQLQMQQIRSLAQRCDRRMSTVSLSSQESSSSSSSSDEESAANLLLQLAGSK